MPKSLIPSLEYIDIDVEVNGERGRVSLQGNKVNLYILYSFILFEGWFLVSACVLIRTRRGEFEEVAKNLRQFKEVKKIFPILGRWDVVADVEAPDMISLGNAILRMTRMDGVVFTETLVEVQQEG